MRACSKSPTCRKSYAFAKMSYWQTLRNASSSCAKLPSACLPQVVSMREVQKAALKCKGIIAEAKEAATP